ncbi:hypothetical protein [Phenylobacterium sp.]|uniref:hypothetical protein n=1 Tax=Phenylobacterium sp. TaxID=1871053 RepID=UPI0025E4110C|nr:hypothetical protein [Phenylobacterium sp.]
MTRAHCAAYGFAIFQEGDAWVWESYGPDGRLRASGRAPTRATAAAFVVREITRSERSCASQAA